MDHPNARLVLDVSAEEQGRDPVFTLAQRAWPNAVQAPEPLDVVPIVLHAGRPITVSVRLAAAWSVTQLQTVQETERVPRTATRTESYYDSSSRSSRSRTVTVTEYDTRTRTVTRPVTSHHEAGCTATFPLRPEAGAVYLVDDSNLDLVSGCTATPFRQVGRPDGTFALTPP